MIGRSRPKYVTLLIAIVTIGSVIPIVAGLMLVNKIFVVEFYFVSVSFRVVGATYVMLGLIGLMLAYGLWKSLRGIWTVTLAVCVVALLFSFVLLPLGFGGLFIKLTEIYLLTRTSVKEFFSAGF